MSTDPSDPAGGWRSPTPQLEDFTLDGSERDVLQLELGFHRTTLLNICAGLSAQQLEARPLATSNLSLLGLVRHLAKVERVWLRVRVAGEDVTPLYDFERRLDTDFDDLDAADAPFAVEQLIAEWALADAAVADVGLDHLIVARDEPMSLRGVYVHLIQEYARHNGHADLLREAIDGTTGR